jgi:mono/diheme cytochrome c family protein
MKMLRGCGAALTKAYRLEGSCQWNTLRTASGRILMVAVSALMIFGTTRVRARTAAQSSKPAAAPAGNAQNGRKLFVKYGCYECHGYEAQGSIATGPRLGPDPVPLQAFIAYVRKPTGEMPPYTDKVMSDQELTDIHAFLQSLPQPPPAKDIPLLR